MNTSPKIKAMDIQEEIFELSRQIPKEKLLSSLIAKYDISHSDALKAIDLLLCFFHARKIDKKKLIILPQVSDWAWHEFILDTRSYHQFTKNIFGTYLPHMKIVPDGDAFNDSIQLFNNNYDIDLNNTHWIESGWKSPAYRFLDIWNTNIKLIETHTLQFLNHSKLEPLLSSELNNINFEWLKERVAVRFNINMEVAALAIYYYQSILISVKQNGVYKSDHLPSIALWAWQEHILWTEKYKNDCNLLFNAFLHHAPAQASQLFSVENVRLNIYV